MQLILQQVGMMFVFILAGYVLGVKKLLDASQSKILSVILIYVVLPCNAFNSFCTRFTAAYLKEKYVVILWALGLVAAAVALAKLFAKLLTKDSYESVIYEYSLCMPNTGYMGYPVVGGVYGAATLTNFMFFVMPMTVMMYVYYLPRMTKKKGISLKALLNPALVGIALGMLVGLLGVPVPEFVQTVSSTASACLGPVSMLMTGITISQFSLKTLWAGKKSFFVILYRMLLLPVAVWLLLRPLCEPELVRIAVLAFAMPCGMNTIVFPKLVGEDSTVGASLPFVSTLVCMVTLPIFLYLLR